MKISRKEARKRRKQRIKKKVFGNDDRLRLVVFRSNKYIYAQIINDENGKTVVSSSSLQMSDGKCLNKEISDRVGQDIAKKALDNNIDRVVFDRNGYTYHGRIMALAEGARQTGLKFYAELFM